MKLSKPEIKLHDKAIELLSKDVLTSHEKEFVLINFQEGATNTNSIAGAFFTPLAMAFEFANEASWSTSPKFRIIDLCAGIGALSYAINTCYKNGLSESELEIVCVEYNYSYYEVGKKILPEATWIHGDATNLDMLKELGHFDMAISNPPFGNVLTLKDKQTPLYKGSDAEYKIIDIANAISDYGIFILPQASSGFSYSGKQFYSQDESNKYKRFKKHTGLELEVGMGIDTTYEGLYSWEYSDGTTVENRWKGVNPMVEFATCEFSRFKKTANTLF